nr:ATP-binding protein [Halonatronum saccharophilum]
MENQVLEEGKNSLDVRKAEELFSAYNLVDNFVKKNYLINLASNDIVPVSDKIKNLKVSDSIRIFKLNKVVYDSKEDNLDKLLSVYNTIETIGGSLILIIDSDGKKTDFYIGIKVASKDSAPSSAQNALKKSLSGNFAGTEVDNLTNSRIEELTESLLKTPYRESNRVVSSVSGIPSLKDQDKEKFVQGIEKLIDSMSGEKFSAIFIADPVEDQKIEEIRRGYENLYSQLIPFAKTDLNFSENESKAITEGVTEGFTKTVNHSLSQTQSHAEGTSTSVNESSSKGKTRNAGGVIGAAGAGIGFAFGGPLGAIAGGAVGGVIGGMVGSSTDTETTGHTQTANTSDSSSKTLQRGESTSDSVQKNNSETNTLGGSRSLQINLENKVVMNLLDEIEGQLDRVKEGKDFGMWNSAFYFIADDRQTSEIAASTFKAIIRGENSAIESSFINTWDNSNDINLIEMQNYLRKFHHPLIDLDVDNNFNIPYVTPGSLLSGRELTIPFGFPKKSVNGLSVIEMAEFGRNIISHNNREGRAKVDIGNIFHMGKAEDTRVEIDVNSLAMHTFITGSTGSGKSNTICNLLDNLDKKGINFLAIEPAKGEYKSILGGRNDVNVYGTNPKFTPMLKINPFKFRDSIHVLEHIDRLIEIFNACWPMYAAMPAVLKEGIERVYEMKGWDLEYSRSFSGVVEYPSFEDLAKVLPMVIQESGYSQELKSNYTGALVTRVNSLTNGLVGRVFSSDEIENEKLFKENCIVDLSRIGSVETKSLIMGILFLRLQEDRYADFSGESSDLKHVTVLEEAHNLLRKTSLDQSQEGANLQGKSVEMISNSIAEMRSYGEGFIIADQSPNLLDQSVIKNTNTKIILRLPDEEDRQLVGRAAGLNEDQIRELAKLRTGVAAIYQNDWLEPILAKIDRYEVKVPFSHISNIEEKVADDKEMRSQLIKLLLRFNLEEEIDLSYIDIEKLKNWLTGEKIKKKIKEELLVNLDNYKRYENMELWDKSKFEEVSEMISEFFDTKRLVRFAFDSNDFIDWTDNFKFGLKNYVEINNVELENILVKHLLNNKAKDDEGFKDFYFNWVERVERKGGII